MWDPPKIRIQQPIKRKILGIIPCTHYKSMGSIDRGPNLGWGRHGPIKIGIYEREFEKYIAESAQLTERETGAQVEIYRTYH
ncbi:hypothetical protein HYV50_01950 [Candidatus Pacearchaeota archaeon]|nr:hypothetical protein [Candidatus Pacearchaeota archaeon]